MKVLDVTDKIKIGENLISILQLKEDKEANKINKRYKTLWGNKTALGIYETVKRIMEDN
jgi:hypothetical protein